MTITICPRCQRRVLVSFDSSDVIHECNSGKDTLDQEDVLVTGDWVDYTGSKSDISAPNMQGAANQLFGTRGGLEGENVQTKTDRGVVASTRRQRQHLHFIELKGGECDDEYKTGHNEGERR